MSVELKFRWETEATPGTTAINDTFEIAALHTLVFSGEPDRNALVYSGLMPKEKPA